MSESSLIFLLFFLSFFLPSFLPSAFFLVHISHSSLFLSVQSIGQFEVVGKGWDSSLGGFAFDVRLAEMLGKSLLPLSENIMGCVLLQCAVVFCCTSARHTKVHYFNRRQWSQHEKCCMLSFCIVYCDVADTRNSLRHSECSWQVQHCMEQEGEWQGKRSERLFQTNDQT